MNITPAHKCKTCFTKSTSMHLEDKHLTGNQPVTQRQRYSNKSILTQYSPLKHRMQTLPSHIYLNNTSLHSLCCKLVCRAHKVACVGVDNPARQAEIGGGDSQGAGLCERAQGGLLDALRIRVHRPVPAVCTAQVTVSSGSSQEQLAGYLFHMDSMQRVVVKDTYNTTKQADACNQSKKAHQSSQQQTRPWRPSPGCPRRRRPRRPRPRCRCPRRSRHRPRAWRRRRRWRALSA